MNRFLGRTRVVLVLLLMLVIANDRVAAQCTMPQGSARLALSGLPRLGNQMQLVFSATTGVPFAILADWHAGNCPTPWGQICLDCATLFPVVQGLVPSMPLVYAFQIPPDPTLVSASAAFQGISLDSRNPIMLGSSTLQVLNVAAAPVTTVYFEDFEAGQGLWSATNGVWQIGTPTAGPAAAWSAPNCAGTNLSGNYPHSQDTTLLSPPITFPSVAPDQEIRLTYRVWFSTEDCCDSCQPWINGAAAPGSVAMSGSNGVWVQAGADLTTFAGMTIPIGFRFRSSSCCNNSSGVYIDDVHVFAGNPTLRGFEDWENGISDWWFVDNGLWQVGVPGPCGPPNSGMQCAGTVLAGNYSDNANTRLISPAVTLSTQTLLAFWECFQTEQCCDTGQVQISQKQAGGGWTPWAPLGNRVSGSSSGWTQRVLNLPMMYQGQTVRVGFYFSSSSCCTRGAGWYIDDIRFL